MRKRGLGRGFEAIIPTDITGSSAGERIAQIPVAGVAPNPHQPRQDFKASDLQGLADSIRHHGILQPLVVTKTDSGYELIAGERRLRAAKLAGLTEVPAIVRSFDEQQKLELALIENLQRADLNAIETAAAYRKLVDEFNMTPSEIAKKVGQALPTVSNTMRLLNLTPEVQKLVVEGKLSEGHARALLPVDDAQRQIEAAELVIKNGWTARQTEEFVRNLKQDQAAPAAQVAKKVASTNELTKGLQDYLGTKVTLQPTAKGGKLLIEYKSEDQLEAIYRTIKGEG